MKDSERKIRKSTGCNEVSGTKLIFEWLILLDMWLLLGIRHCLQCIIKSRALFMVALLVMILTVGITGFQMLQFETNSLAEVDLVREIATKEWNSRHEFQLSAEELRYYKILQSAMKRLYADYKLDIDKLKWETEASIRHLQVQSSTSNQQSRAVCKENSILHTNEAKIRELIKHEIDRYEAEKLGMADYALETSGGSIIATPDTKTHEEDAWVSLWGISLFRIGRNNPRNIIQGPMEPGSCWAFYGSTGNVVIQLSAAIHITAVTIEHISVRLATTGSINSAPKDFTVIGYKYDSKEEINLGSFSYNKDGPVKQMFEVKNKDKLEQVFESVKLSILSNHGHPDYTCIYRFRVHGELPQAN